jgi:hypothetical protein
MLGIYFIPRRTPFAHQRTSAFTSVLKKLKMVKGGAAVKLRKYAVPPWTGLGAIINLTNALDITFNWPGLMPRTLS